MANAIFNAKINLLCTREPWDVGLGCHKANGKVALCVGIPRI